MLLMQKPKDWDMPPDPYIIFYDPHYWESNSKKEANAIGDWIRCMANCF
jgi:hypothetical protein